MLVLFWWQWDDFIERMNEGVYKQAVQALARQNDILTDQLYFYEFFIESMLTIYFVVGIVLVIDLNKRSILKTFKKCKDYLKKLWSWLKGK